MGDYVQYMFNGVLLNPAYAGSQGALNITALYRNQWVGIDGAPVSKSFSAHTPLKNKKINLGLIAENERFGIYEHTRINGLYAYRVKFLRGELAAGIQAGVDLQSTNWNKVVVTEVNDPNFSGIPVRQTAFIAGAGLFYNSERFYAGLSSPQIFSNYLNKNSTSIFNCGTLIDLSSNFKIKPALLCKYLHGSPLMLNISSTFYYKELLGIGAGYTIGNLWMAYLDVKFNDQLHFGYGYDRSVNNLKTYSGGSHEIMLRYLFSFKLKVVNARYF
jgi:type IX secretion system PorP/SprF family membrane protein